MSPKFKVGDEVVIVKEFEVYGYKDGDVGIIQRIEPKEFTYGVLYRVNFNKRKEDEPVYEFEMELTEVARSPLWKALE